jgi:O-antigen/teichoic acid export membrane protein
MVPLMINVLDQERYGVWLTLSTIFLWFSNFDIGLGNGLRNKLAEAAANRDFELGRIYVSTTYALLTIIFVSLALLFLFINPLINWNKILNSTAIGSNELFLLSSFTFIFFLFRFIFQLLGVVYIALQRPSINNILVALGSLFAFLIVWGLYGLFEITNLIVIGMVLTGIPLVVFILANFFAFRGDLKLYAPSIKYVRFNYSKELFVLGGQFFIIQIAAIVLFSTANILISQLFNPTEVVVYNSVLQYYNIPIMLYSIILTPLWSAITEAYIQNDYDWMKRTLLKYNYISLVFVFGIIALTVISPFVYEIWLNGKVEIPMNLSIAMACFATINVLLSPYTSYINGIGKLRLSILMVCFSILGYIPFAIWLGQSFGSSVGIVVALCCINVTGLYFQVRQVNMLLNKKASGIWLK